ncbi:MULTISPECIES: formate dehydrogenase subunit delta [Burkholderia]|uniref:formate dehydrogenase subunit delta n=1 Tax=Burkholderia TaxID=32008 RepID=UPI0003C43C15|nr:MULTISPECIES: formate dehydrogenase subunit delta [Burkholderia]ESS39920.1 NAD-dependent formate dehydrogenase delta subunit [Burkholderia cenocepacia KC-01]ELK7719283.1 formate dehydrogenase subunit delta [Burkholderia cenocepacia]MBL3964059.1 formate dehydrogenase subunit delta [Burkholderia sp. KCJ3K979]MBR8305084.1 formate dehydrogenase subunit delta [Burkholderia cenocepacia]MCA7964269.1 formate dehydrogenase subunit delta [Burkholderia cenocepacia]
MNSEHLIDMANQIGAFFESMPDRDEALTGIAEHIRRFWEPRMRRALLVALDDPSREAGQRATPIVRDAIAAHRASLVPAAAPA